MKRVASTDECRIKEGDKVRVYFENVEWIDGTVRYMPQATGDSWIIVSADKIHYVNMFARITKEL